ncbi:restriction endonuclease subunit S [Chryseobacterium gambrini]|uniref:restriction endonuclease subunit S n=1 Tax=Chryseobacterium gambrini TaxID=373672 RepID=UPI0022F3F32D|nr:restriction endonuclease subunit S [Chryseobacterium gambrini]WBX98508.1 restriction endonuclease subunit S [Chryseobacterium gambrini]
MTNKKLNVANVPNLRFPGFEGEWETRKLGEMAEKVNSGKTPLGGESVYINEGILFIRSQNVNNDKLELQNSVFISESINNVMKNSVVRSNDILLNITGASLGRSCVVPEDFKIGNVNQHVCIIRLNKKYNPRFLQPIFSSIKGQIIFNNLQTGSGREGLNFESIKSIKLSIPGSKEQKKIASFLSILDERISTQNKIIEELETLIKGLCQKIFELDLFQFSVLPLKLLCVIKKGQQINASELSKKGLYYVMNGGILPSGYHSEYNSDAETISISEGGNSCGYIQYNYYKFWSGGHCYTLNKINKKIKSKYLYYYLKANENKIMALRVGSGLPNIQKSALEKFEVKIPNLYIQDKVILALDSLSNKFFVENKLLRGYQQQKNYLLQNLFI